MNKAPLWVLSAALLALLVSSLVAGPTPDGDPAPKANQAPTQKAKTLGPSAGHILAAKQSSAGTMTRADLEDHLDQSGSEPHWLSYEIDTIPDLGFACCVDSSRFHGAQGIAGATPSRCRPDKRRQNWMTWRDLDVEASDRLRILLRLRDGKIERVRAYSPGCPLELEHPVTHAQVEQGESLSFLTRLAEENDLTSKGDRLEEERIDMVYATIARHVDEEAGAILVELAEKANSPVRHRNAAIFWLGQTRGAFAVKALLELLDREGDRQIREHIVFSLSQTQTPDNQGTTELIRLLRESERPEIRRQALFWIADSEDPRAYDLLAQVLR